MHCDPHDGHDSDSDDVQSTCSRVRSIVFPILVERVDVVASGMISSPFMYVDTVDYGLYWHLVIT